MSVLRPALATFLLAAVLATGAVLLDRPTDRATGGTGGAEQPSGFLQPVAAPPSGPVGEQDGVVPDGSPVPPDADVPAVTGLDPDLLAAVRAAARDAAADGVTLRITSGWRSPRYQQLLLDRAVAERGEAEARRWVAGPETSRHVTGEAVDVGPTDAADWVLRHGDRYGLCQAYANELWHYELLTTPGGSCPAPRADASAG